MSALRHEASRLRQWGREFAARCRNAGRSAAGWPLPSSLPEDFEAARKLRRDGTVRLDGVLSPTLLARLQEDASSVLGDTSSIHWPVIDVSLRTGPDDTRNDRPVSRDEVDSMDQLWRDHCPRYVQHKFNPAGGWDRATDSDRLWLNEVVAHPRLLSVVMQAMSIVPVYRGHWLRQSRVVPTPVDNLCWHRDGEDPRYLIKLFVYLNDVSADNGAHAYVKGSHRVVNPGRFSKTRFTDEEILTTFGSEAQVVHAGPAGTVILEDTRGYHRGLPVSSGERIMFAGVYTGRPETPLAAPPEELVEGALARKVMSS